MTSYDNRHIKGQKLKEWVCLDVMNETNRKRHYIGYLKYLDYWGQFEGKHHMYILWDAG